MKPNTIVIHYSATYPDQSITRDDVEKWHRKRGFRSIGYHWFIRRDGTLEEGRPEDEIGAHVRGHNSGTIGICYAGGLERASGSETGVWNPTPAQEETMARLIRDVMRRHPTIKRVVGHKDLAATQCPGGDAAAWWAAQGDKPRTSPAESTTVQASVAQGASGVAAVAGALGALDGTAQIVAIVLGVVVLLAAAWVMRERLRKWAEGDR